MPLVTVIIPTFNRAHLVCEAVESVLRQSHPDAEAIVIDDASGDDTQRILAERFRAEIEQRRLLVLRNETRQERSVTRNRGIAAARGEYIAFLDDDDLFLPHHLEKCLQRLRHCDAVGAGGFDTDLEGNPIRPHAFPFRGRLTANELALLGLGINCCNAVVRREVVQHAGGFREDMHQGEDIDFFMRVAMTGRVQLVKKRTVHRRVHDSHYTFDRQAMNRIRFQDGLKTMLLENSSRLGYPLSSRLLGYLHLLLAWNGVGACQRRYALDRLKEALHHFPLLVLTEPHLFRVVGRMLLLANLPLYELLRRAKQSCRTLSHSPRRGPGRSSNGENAGKTIMGKTI